MYAHSDVPSLVVMAANENVRLNEERENRRPDSSVILQFKTTTTRFFLTQYDFYVYEKIADLVESLPLVSLITEGQLVAKKAPQIALGDAADAGARSIAFEVVMHRSSWLKGSGFPERQATVEDLPLRI